MKGILVVMTVILAATAEAASYPDPPAGTTTERIWTDATPGALGDQEADKPTLTIFPLPAEKRNGAAVIVCPGGGYHGHAMGYEGYEVAQMFNNNGVVAFVLRYRVAPYQHPAPLQDAQRAIRLVRSRALEFGVDPNRIGILGFSAGGHLSATTGTHFDSGNPDAPDPIDRVSSRPDFMVLIYPVISMKPPYGHMGSRNNLLGENPDPALVENLCNDQQVTPETPPVFLVASSADSGVPAENSVQFYLACRQHKVPAELHVYQNGEHGFGMGKGDPILTTWPPLCIQWMEKLNK